MLLDQWRSRDRNASGGRHRDCVTGWYRGVLAIGPGTYTLSASLVVDVTLSDGWDTILKGTILEGTCTFTVTA